MKRSQLDISLWHWDFLFIFGRKYNWKFVQLVSCTVVGSFYWKALLQCQQIIFDGRCHFKKKKKLDLESWMKPHIMCYAFVFFQSPLRLRANSHSVERSLGFHGSCGSLPREARVQAVPRAKGSPMHTYKSVEITNVWTALGHQDRSHCYYCLHWYCIIVVYYWERTTLLSIAGV